RYYQANQHKKPTRYVTLLLNKEQFEKLSHDGSTGDSELDAKINMEGEKHSWWGGWVGAAKFLLGGVEGRKYFLKDIQSGTKHDQDELKSQYPEEYWK
ncbi:MAG: hypothetical protein WCL07_03195, partial [bacterium]